MVYSIFLKDLLGIDIFVWTNGGQSLYRGLMIVFEGEVVVEIILPPAEVDEVLIDHDLKNSK